METRRIIWLANAVLLVIALGFTTSEFIRLYDGGCHHDEPLGAFCWGPGQISILGRPFSSDLSDILVGPLIASIVVGVLFSLIYFLFSRNLRLSLMLGLTALLVIFIILVLWTQYAVSSRMY